MNRKIKESLKEKIHKELGTNPPNKNVFIKLFKVWNNSLNLNQVLELKNQAVKRGYDPDKKEELYKTFTEVFIEWLEKEKIEELKKYISYHDILELFEYK